MVTLRSSSMEIKDNAGTTLQYAGTVSAGSPVTISNGGIKIDEFVIRNMSSNRDIEVKMGSNTTPWTVKKNCDYLIWTPKGVIDEITIEAPVGSADYELIVNWADC